MCGLSVPWWVPSGAHWPTAKSTGLAPSQRRGRVRLLLRTPLCSGIRWYFRASISRSLHSEWWRTSSSVSTLLIRKSRLNNGSRTHFISWCRQRIVGGELWSGWGNWANSEKSCEVKWVLPKVHAACVHLYHVSPSSKQHGTLPPQMARWDCHWRSNPGPGWRGQSRWADTFSFTRATFSDLNSQYLKFNCDHQKSTCRSERRRQWKLPNLTCQHTGSKLHWPQTAVPSCCT